MRIIPFLFFLFASSILCSQKTKIQDSSLYEKKINWYLEKSKKRTHFDSSFTAVQKGLKKAILKKDLKRIAEFYIQRGELLIIRKKIDSASSDFKSALNISKKQAFQKIKGDSYLALARAEFLNNNQDTMYDYYLKAIQVYEAIDSTKEITYANFYLNASYHIRKRDLEEEGLQFMEKAKEEAKVNSDSAFIAILNLTTVRLYVDPKRKEYQKAIDNLKFSINFYKKQENNLSLIASLINLSSIYFRMNENDKALFYRHKAVNLSKKTGFNMNLNVNYAGLAYIYEAEKKKDTALFYWDKAIEEAKLVKNNRRLIPHYLNASSAYYKFNKPEKAYAYLKEYIKIKDSLENEEVQKRIAELDTKYSLDLKEKELAIAKQENKIKDIENKKQKRQQWLLIGFIFFLTLSSFLFLNQYIVKQKHNKILTINNQIIKRSLEEKEILLKEIHHRVKNNLQLILSLFNLQKSYTPEKSDHEFMNKMKDKINAIALVHEKLYGVNNFSSISLKAYFKDLIYYLSQTYNLSERSITITSNIDDHQLSMNYLSPCGLIVNELIINAVKHAFPNGKSGNIHLESYFNNQTCRITVSDNGIGMSEDTETSKLGLKLIRGLVNQLNGELEITSNSGTSTKIEFKVTT
ncbi:histidine kinase dimerization/phosphoacceptor domain -containing protein [Aquimarina sp. LLG6339-5]|uniref:tetratricopeptide repeat-containing sensor histidine kinase n=1 Tax=Aquimarina sp. LLG6339-5 TaxID=3160830 RepID=UPI00386631D3